MTNKKYISGLLISLLTLSGCVFDINPSGQSASTNSSSDNSNTSASSSTHNANNENYFSSSDTALLEDYFGFVVPSLNLEYVLEDYSSEAGYTFVVIYFDNASEEDFASYIELLGNKFTFVEEGEYESDYWYCYEEGNFAIETCYDDYSGDFPFIYLHIYDASDIGSEGGDDSGNEDVTIKETVNGYFDSEDTALLNSSLDFKVPCIGSEYYLLDETYEGLVDIYIYFFGVNANDFETFNNELEKVVTFDEIYSDPDTGYDIYCYSSEAYYIDVIFDDSTAGEEFVYVNIYDPLWLEY